MNEQTTAPAFWQGAVDEMVLNDEPVRRWVFDRARGKVRELAGPGPVWIHLWRDPEYPDGVFGILATNGAVEWTHHLITNSRRPYPVRRASASRDDATWLT